MNKRIAMFSMHSDPLVPLGSREAGGQNLYVKYLLQSLDKIGWSVDVFTRLDDENKREITKVGKNSRVIRIKGGPVEHIPKGNLHAFFPEMYENFLKFAKEEGNGEYELFHGHHYDGGWVALQAHNQFNKPLFTTFHSLGRIRLRTQKTFLGKTLEDKILNERFDIEQSLVENSCVIIELAESEKDHLVDLYKCSPDKIKVVPGGVNIEEFKSISKNKAREMSYVGQKDFIILFVGRMEWRKGIATLIHALKLVKEKISNAKLVVVGGKIFGEQFNEADKKEYERLLEVADKLHNVKDDVKFVGAVNHGDLPKYYSSADVLVIPSYYEPFGLVAIEGLASKVPVVASRVGGLKVTIQDGVNGLLFESRNPSDLAKKIITLYNSKELADKFIEKGYQDVLDNYSWESIIKQISSFYQEEIDKNKENKNNEKEIKNSTVSSV